MDIEQTFGVWLRQRRRALDLTQEELAARVGCSAITLRKLESEDRRPSKQIAERLAEVLTIPTDERADFLRFARGDPFAAPAAGSEPPIRQIPAISAAVSTKSSSSVEIVGEAAPAAGESPFKGLRFFDEPDAALFFGRATLVGRLLARVTTRVSPAHGIETRFLAVVGASGSGKSSVVRAGLIPALRKQGGAAHRFDPIHVLTPTAHPLEALAVSLARDSESVTAAATLLDDMARDERSLRLYLRQRFDQAGSVQPEGGPPRLLLVIDQFEELFTLCRSEADRRAFVANLMRAVEPETSGGLTLVITLRADFYAHCSAYVALRDSLAAYQEYIGPMDVAELRQAIELPAKLGGWDFEPGLVDLILHDVGDEPGALPLLSHALLETWRHRRGRMLTLKSYTDAGRVQGAIANTAESVYQALPAPQQAIARNIFLRLTELGDGTQHTRRRVALAELLPPGQPSSATDPVSSVLKTLSDARLITQDDVSVEVAHEALIAQWPTLRQWLAEDRDGLRLHRHLTEAAQAWDALSRDPGELYRGLRVAQAQEWAAAHPADLNVLEREFLAASRETAEREAAEREAQRQRELDAAVRLAQTEKARAETERSAGARLRTRNRIISGLGLVAVIAAMVAAIFSSRSASLAADKEALASTAEASARLASARELAFSAADQVNIDPQRGLLLALQAVDRTHSLDGSVLPEAAAALHGAVSASHLLQQLRVTDIGVAVNVVFSPDGQRLAVADQAAATTVWDISAGASKFLDRPIYTVPGVRPLVDNFAGNTIVFSRDGAKLFTVSDGYSVQAWDAATGKTLPATYEFFGGGALTTVAFDPGDKRIALGGYGAGLAGVRDAGTNATSVTLCCIGSITSVAFSPDGRWIAGGSSFNRVLVWEASSGQMLHNLSGHQANVTRVAISPDGSRLASASYDGTVRVWDSASGKQVLLLAAGSPYTVVFSPDGKSLATGGTDGIARVWDVVTGQQLLTRNGHTRLIHDVAFSLDGARLATASADGLVKLWDTAPDQELVTLLSPATQFYSVAFSPDGTRMITGSRDKRGRIWNAATGTQVLELASRLDFIYGVAFSPDGKRIATAGNTLVPKVWDATTGELLLGLYGHLLNGWSIAFSPDGTRLAVTNPGANATIFDAANGDELLSFVSPTTQTDPDALYFFVPSNDQPNQDLGTFDYQTAATLAFSPDGLRLVTSNQTKFARVWDVFTGEAQLSLTGHTGILQSVAYSPDGKRIATSGRDGTARVWDAESGEMLQTLIGHTASVISVAFSPDGNTIATGSVDRTAKLWDTATGRLLQTLPGPTLPITSIAFSPDGNSLAVASLDGTTRLYLTHIDALIALAKSRVIRALTADECQQYLHGPCPAN